MPVTPADVAFTYEYLTHDGLYQSVHLYGEVWDVGQVVISSIYKRLFSAYNTTYNNILWYSSTVTYPSGKTVGIDPVYYNDIPGYTWENLTWICGPDALNGSNTVVPALLPAGPNPFAPQNFVQFSNTMGPNQLTVYFTDTSGWFLEPFELSVPIIPMFIWANLAEDAWPYSAAGSGFVTPSSFIMVLGPMAGGANLLYGSGPFIWTSGTATSYTLKPYVTGTSYGIPANGLVTEDTGYWASAVRVADVGGVGNTYALGAQPLNYYYKAGTSTLYMQIAERNWIANNSTSLTPQETFEVTPVWWNATSGKWIWGSQIPSAPVSVTVPQGAIVWTPWVAIPLPVTPKDCTWAAIYLTAITIIGGIRKINDPGYVQNQWSPYAGTSGIATINVAEPKGDITGGTLANPYQGAQGKVNLVSLSLITGNWLKSGISWTGSFNPTDTLHRADINAQGKINLVSLSFVTGEWLHTWNLNTAKPPVTPPLPPLP
jgi:hypothetical protein